MRGYPLVVLILSVLVQAHVAVGSQGIPAIGVFIQRDLQITKSELGVFVSLAQIGAASMLFLGGWLSDTFGPRRTLAFGLLLITVGMLWLTQASSTLVAAPALLLSGIGNGLCSPGTTMAIVHWLPVRVRGFAVGVKQTGVPIAGIVLAGSLPPLSEAFGWRGAVTAAGTSVLLMSIAWAAIYRDKVNPAATTTTAANGGASSWSMLRNPSLLAVSIFAACGTASQFSTISYLILYLNESAGYSVVVAGWVLAVAQLGGLTGRIVWGLASDRLMGARRKPVLVATAGLGSAVLVALALTPGPSLALAFGLAFCLGLTILSWHGMHQLSIAELMGAAGAGRAIGISMTILQLGAISGPPIFGSIVDRSGSFQYAWLVLATFSALGALSVGLFMREPALGRASVRV